MTLPNVNVTFSDGNLGITPEVTDGIVLVLGPSTMGLWNTLHSFSNASLSALTGEVGTGKGVQAVSQILSTPNHGPVYFVPLQSTAGVNGAVTPPSSSAPALTLTGNPLDDLEGKVQILTGGARGTATFKYSFDDGRTWSNTITTAATYSTDIGLDIPTAAITSSGTTPPAITLTGTPLRAMNLRVECTVPGARGTAKVRVSIDGGATWNAEVLTAATLPVYDPADGSDIGVVINYANAAAAVDNVWTSATRGFTLNFASGTYVANDTYTWSSVAPVSSNTHITNALDAVKALGVEVGWVHVACGSAGATDTDRGTDVASQFSAIDAKIVAWEAAPAYKFVGCTLDGPSPVTYKTSAGMSTWRAAMIVAQANLSSKRTGIGGGYMKFTSDLDQRQYRRSAAWRFVNRVSSSPIGEHAGRVLSGSDSRIVSIEHDESANEGLDAARFITMRTVAGRQGFFVTNGQQMSAAGSDYASSQNLRVINRFTKTLRNALLNYLNEGVQVDASTGHIREDEAKAIDQDLTSQVTASILGDSAGAQASSVYARVSRTDDILSTETLTADGGVQPLGYAKHIAVTVGFTQQVAVGA